MEILLHERLRATYSYDPRVVIISFQNKTNI